MDGLQFQEGASQKMKSASSSTSANAAMVLDEPDPAAAKEAKDAAVSSVPGPGKAKSWRWSTRAPKSKQSMQQEPPDQQPPLVSAEVTAVDYEATLQAELVAEAAYMEDLYKLGNVFYEGVGVDKDVLRAASRWQKASSLGHKDSERMLRQHGPEIEQAEKDRRRKKKGEQPFEPDYEPATDPNSSAWFGAWFSSSSVTTQAQASEAQRQAQVIQTATNATSAGRQGNDPVVAETEIEEMAETEDADPNHDAARDPAGSEEPTQSRSQESSLYTPSVDRDSPVRMDDRESPIWGSIDHNDGLVHVPNNSTDEKDERDKAKKKSKSRFSISFRRGKTKSKLQEVGEEKAEHEEKEEEAEEEGNAAEMQGPKEESGRDKGKEQELEESVKDQEEGPVEEDGAGQKKQKKKSRFECAALVMLMPLYSTFYFDGPVTLPVYSNRYKVWIYEEEPKFSPVQAQE